jgi:hypothetical protein
MPPPSAVVDGVDLVLAVRPGDGVRFDDPGIPATVLRGLLRVSHDASYSRRPSATTRARWPAVVSGGESIDSSRR